MTILTKTELDCRRRVRSEVTLQEALDNHNKKDSLPKGIKETLLSELEELFLPYWSDTTDNIVTVPAMDAVELVLKTICHWSEEVNSRRAAGAANISLMEKLQTLRAKAEAAKEEIARLSKPNLSESGTGKEIDPNLAKAIEDKEYLQPSLRESKKSFKAWEISDLC